VDPVPHDPSGEPGRSPGDSIIDPVIDPARLAVEAGIDERKNSITAFLSIVLEDDSILIL